MALIVRELTGGEWDRLAELPHFSEFGVPPPDKMRIVVIEDETQTIVGFWCVMRQVHLEPIWIAPEMKSPMAVAQMIGKIVTVLQDEEVAAGLAIIDRPEIASLAERLGFEPVPGTIYQLKVPEPQLRDVVEAADGSVRN